MVFEIFVIENPAGFAFGVAILLFAIIYSVFSKLGSKNKGTAVVVASVFSAVAAWQLYQKEFYGYQAVIGTIFIVIVILLFLRIIWGFFKGAKSSFRG